MSWPFHMNPYDLNENLFVGKTWVKSNLQQDVSRSYKNVLLLSAANYMNCHESWF